MNFVKVYVLKKIYSIYQIRSGCPNPGGLYRGKKKEDLQYVLFTVADSNSFLSHWKILQEINK